MQIDILTEIRAAMDKAIADGESLTTFRNRLEPTLRAKGWWGKKIVDGKPVQLGSPHRLRIIYDTNLRTAYARGKWERIERVAKAMPWLRYVATLDDRTRPQHRAWHGVTLRYDDPFWRTHFPPNGWNCRCTVTQYSDADLKRRGWAPTKRPLSRRRPWLNKRTGRVESVPAGIDPGFAFNAGRVDLGKEASAHLIAKIEAAPPDMRAAAIGRPWETARFRRFVRGRGTKAEQIAPGDWPIAIMPARIMRATDAQARVVRLSPGSVKHIRDHHPDVTPGNYALVQRILDAGEFYHSTPMHVVGYLELGGMIWTAVFKTTGDRQELFLQSFHRGTERNLAAARRNAERVK